MFKAFIFAVVAMAATQSFAFELNEYTVFGCQNFNSQVSINLKKGVMSHRFGFKVVPFKIQNIQILNDERAIQFDEVSDGNVTTYRLQNIYQGYNAAVVYADLYLDGQKVNGCAGYLN